MLASLRAWTGQVVRWSGVVSLNYHRIGEARGSWFDHGLWSASPEGFDAQVGFLKAHFDVIRPEELGYALKVKRGRHVLITFDDGYADNHAVAFPILKRHGVPATFFVATGFIDAPRLPWWDEIAWMVRTSAQRVLALPGRLPGPLALEGPDREPAVRALLRAYKRLSSAETDGFIEALGEAAGTGRYQGTAARDLWMTWDMIREMHAGGMSIGGHTVSHPILSRMGRDEQWREISGCAQRLARELGAPMRAFSYPVGGRDAFNEDTRECLRRVGVRWAFSYYGGFRSFRALGTGGEDSWDDLDVRRIPVERDMDLARVRAEVMLPQVDAWRFPWRRP